LWQFSLTRCHAAGTVIAWGANNAGQTLVPLGLSNVVAVAGGLSHSLALNADGTVTAWGFNVFGQTNVPADLLNASAIGGGVEYSMALRADGTVSVWGNQLPAPSDLTNAVGIAAGAYHCLAVTSDGRVVAWGGGSSAPAWLTNVVSVAAGSSNSLALLNDSTVVAWGDNTYGKTNVPPGLSNVVAIAAGADHCLALVRDGTVVAWGGNYAGQASVPTGLTNVVAISGGSKHTVVLRNDGSLVAWGDNTYGQATVNTNQTGFIGIAAGGFHNLSLRGGAPVILVQPSDQSVPISHTALFQVMAAGNQPLRYQWQKNGTNLAGATRSSLALANVQATDAATYSVVITNILGTVTSTGARLIPYGIIPYIITQPQDQVAICGENASFQVTADGTKPLRYQWLFSGTPIADATRTVLNLTNVATADAGPYQVVVNNDYGSVTSAPAILTVTVDPVLITSPLTASGSQGQPFTYTITAQHSPILFRAIGLPPGLTVNTNTGVISGIPLESGSFAAIIIAINRCVTDQEILIFTFSSSAPVITSALTATGNEGIPFSYAITASQNPTWFGAQNLPAGLYVDSGSGLISGSPLYGGDSFATIMASNIWGAGSATVHLTITNAVITGLSIANVTTNYTSPYLLDFQFSLRDDNDPTQGKALSVDPVLLSAQCFEDTDVTNSPSTTAVRVSPSETAVMIQRGNAKVVKSYLVLDFTESIASLSNGDTNNDGISDAVDNMVSGAEQFVDQQSATTQVGVYEFHREDWAPTNVISLTTDKAAVKSAIAGIWTNYVQWFPAGSRCWDALDAAILSLGASNPDEQHYAVFVSDGTDESSIATLDKVITDATNNNVRVYCIGFGDALDPVPLQTIAAATAGRYYAATNSGDLAAQFLQIGKDLNGQYILRWATLKRSNKLYRPSFQITYQGITAFSPVNPGITYSNYVDTSTNPPVTNVIPVYTYTMAPFNPTNYAGPVTVGNLRLVPNADVHPTGITLRATYVPRYVRQLRIHFRANWPCTTSLQSTNPGEMLYLWSMSETNDGAGGKWMLLSSPNPAYPSNSIPFASFGNLVNFNFQDYLATSNAFSVFEVDTNIYTNIIAGGQSFVVDTNLSSFLTVYPPMPHATPVPWLIQYGAPAGGPSNIWAQAELQDPDKDGMLNWQEYRADTNPTNAASKLFIRSMTRLPDGHTMIIFPTSANRVYRLECSPDLITWLPLQDNIQGTGSDMVITDTRLLIGNTLMNYRVLVY
jgi:hypothetical protein